MLYELSCLLNPGLSEEEAGEFAKKLESIIGNDAKIVKKDPAKKVGLAYPIEKQTSAFISSIIFEITPEKIGEIKNKLDEDPGIIRFLLVKTKIEERPPRIEKNAASEVESNAKTKPLISPATNRADKPKKEEAAPSVATTPGETKKATKKVEMEKIETELNKILNES